MKRLDKSEIIFKIIAYTFTILFSLIVFKEKLSLKVWIGIVLLTIGTILMAIFT